MRRGVDLHFMTGLGDLDADLCTSCEIEEGAGLLSYLRTAMSRIAAREVPPASEVFRVHDASCVTRRQTT